MRRTKISRYILTVILMLTASRGSAQYLLQVLPVDKDSTFIHHPLGLTTSFKSREACVAYIYSLPGLLQSWGYLTASVDSVGADSARAVIRLFVGSTYRWAKIDVSGVDPTLLAGVAWSERSFSHRPLDLRQYQARQQQILDYLENNGYPFGKVSLDSVEIDSSGEIAARLKVEKGPLYHIDSIRLYGTGKISNDFMQRYLGIPDGAIYKKDRLDAISRKILELPYVQEQQPWTLTMLGTGSVLNLYLKPRRSSQINALVGFLPSSDPLLGNKVLITGEATVNLKNALGGGETIGLDWQQLQAGSPKLNLLFQQPYLFHSPFGMSASFDLFKQDSSFINVNMMLGVQYTFSPTQTGSVFIRNLISSLLAVDTFQVLATRALPTEADIRAVSVGVSYEYNNTDYRYNPRTGNEIQLTGSVGTKTIKQNPQIVKLKDASDPDFSYASLYDTVKLKSYQLQVRGAIAHYFRLSRASTLKTAVTGGIFNSPSMYRNELFRLGGYKLLRGFDEETILASRFAVLTAEYRYLIGLNSYLFTFADWGYAKNTVAGYHVDNSYLGTGLGLAFETKAGIFNISYALGKRDDVKFNFRNAKIHLGYVSFF